MTKKDYQLIARVLEKIKDPNVRAEVTENFCWVLKADNPKFDAPTFIRAAECVMVRGKASAQ